MKNKVEFLKNNIIINHVNQIKYLSKKEKNLYIIDSSFKLLLYISLINS